MAAYPHAMNLCIMLWSRNEIKVTIQSKEKGPGERVTSSELYQIIRSGRSAHPLVWGALNPKDDADLIKALQANTSLTNVTLRFQTGNDYKSYKRILASLHDKHNLEYLYLSIPGDFYAGRAPIRLLSTLNLKNLVIIANVENVDDLLRALKRNVELTNLRLILQPISNGDTRRIIDFALDRLSIFSLNDISQDGLDYITEGLKTNDSLKMLTLSGHHDADFAQLGQMLLTNTTLLSLDIINVRGTKNIESLLESAAVNATLLSLELPQLSESEIPALITLLKNNDMLEKLHFSLTIDHVSQELIRALAASKLIDLGIIYTTERSLHATDALLRALRYNTTMKKLLSFDSDQPSNETIVDFLCTNNTLEYLWIPGTLTLSPDQIQQIAETNMSLIEVSDNLAILEPIAERNAYNKRLRETMLLRSTLQRMI